MKKDKLIEEINKICDDTEVIDVRKNPLIFNDVNIQAFDHVFVFLILKFIKKNKKSNTDEITNYVKLKVKSNRSVVYNYLRALRVEGSIEEIQEKSIKNKSVINYSITEKGIDNLNKLENKIKEILKD